MQKSISASNDNLNIITLHNNKKLRIVQQFHSSQEMQTLSSSTFLGIWWQCEVTPEELDGRQMAAQRTEPGESRRAADSVSAE